MSDDIRPIRIRTEEVTWEKGWDELGVFILASFGIPKELAEAMGETVPCHVVEESGSVP